MSLRPEDAPVTRGGRTKSREAPERRCVASGESGPAEAMIRFVIDPEGRVVPDLAGRLPGRGVWVGADRDRLERAVAKSLFARAAKRPATAPDSLVGDVERLLARRVVDAIAMARKAGLAATGFEKVRERLKKGRAAVLLEARDASEQGRGKLAPLARGVEVVGCLDRDELGLAFGRDFVVHAALEQGGAAERVVKEARRLSGFRPRADAELRTPRNGAE